MSYDIHEAYCLDSFSTQLNFWDDFEGDSIKDLWTTQGTGSAAVVDAQDGGIIRLTTGAANGNNYLIWWNNIRTLHVSKKVTMEVRVKLSATTSIDARIRLLFNSSNEIYFRYDTSAGDTNWSLLCVDGGATTTEDSGIAPDTDEHIFRIECLPTGEVHYYIDGVETGNSPITTNIPDDAGDYLQPALFIRTREAVAKSMDVDYCYVRQLR